MKYLNIVLAFVVTVALLGCFHATIETGSTPSTQTIEEPWAACWVFGLVAPNTITTQAKCQHGVAKVETQRSFVNSLVSIITLSIYTPMEIKVTCAAKSTSMIPSPVPDVVVESGATEQQILDGFQKAAELAVRSGKPVYIEY